MKNIHQLFLLVFLSIMLFIGCKDQNTIKKQAAALEQNPLVKEEGFKNTSMAVLQSIIKKDTASFNKLISPKHGLYVIYRPGAFDYYSQINEISDDETVDFRFEVMDMLIGQDLNIRMNYAELPTYDCDLPMDYDKDGWNKRGYFSDSIKTYTPVSSVVTERMEYELDSISPKELDEIIAMEKLSRKVVFTGEILGEDQYNSVGVTFYLMYADGQWWISVLDWLFNDCGV